MGINAVIIEDEVPARVTLKSYIQRYFSRVTVLAEFDNVREAVIYLNRHRVDIIFLDVQLKDGKGVDILNKIDSGKFRIIFTTAYEKYTVEAFRHKSFGYLLKPLDPLDFKKIMNRVLKDISYTDPETKKVKIHVGNEIIWVDTGTIIRCESQSNYTSIVCSPGNEKYTVAKTLKAVETELIDSEEFLRVHQSHLINLWFIDKIEMANNRILLKNGEIVPISRSKRVEIYRISKNFR